MRFPFIRQFKWNHFSKIFVEIYLKRIQKLRSTHIIAHAYTQEVKSTLYDIGSSIQNRSVRLHVTIRRIWSSPSYKTTSRCLICLLWI